MKRLTKHTEKGRVITDCNVCPEHGICFDNAWCTSVLKKRLAAIEDILGDDYSLSDLRSLVDAAGQGLVVTLPCEIGSPVYVIGGKYRGGHFEKWRNSGEFRLSDLEKMGKTVFLTEEEADKALETYKEVFDKERGM